MRIMVPASEIDRLNSVPPIRLRVIDLLTMLEAIEIAIANWPYSREDIPSMRTLYAQIAAAIPPPIK